jgi:phosphoribosylglycinamide formyltransferase
MSDQQHNLTVLISGNGSNLQALIDACASNKLPNTRITHVISKYHTPSRTHRSLY